MSRGQRWIILGGCLIAAAALLAFLRSDRNRDRIHREKWRRYGASASALNKVAHTLGGGSRPTAWVQTYVESLQHRYERESEAQMEALIQSGYLVRTSFPVANLSKYREEVGREWFSFPSDIQGNERMGDNEGVLGLNEASNVVTIICRPKYAPIFGTLFVWRSPASPLQQRAEAAAQLVARGVKRVEAERILGKPARYAHFRAAAGEEPAYASLTNDLTIPAGLTDTEARNLWCDFYDYPGGAHVCFCYDAKASKWWADQPLVRIWLGQTNDARTIRIVKNEH